MALDELDNKILSCLNKNGRVPYASIAKEVNLTATAVGQRVQKMIAEEVIEEFSVKLNPDKFGINIQAVITLKLYFTKMDAFYKYLKKSAEDIEYCYRVTGDDCMILKVNFRNNSHLVEFLDGLSIYGSSKTNIIIDQLI